MDQKRSAWPSVSPPTEASLGAPVAALGARRIDRTSALSTGSGGTRMMRASNASLRAVATASRRSGDSVTASTLTSPQRRCNRSATGRPIPVASTPARTTR